MIKQAVKTLLQTVAPKRYAALSSARANRYGQRILEEHGVPVIAEQFIHRHGAKVQGGPFAGMIYLEQAIGSSFIPKLVGSYESELHGVINQILINDYDVVVDVGCAEGYYAVGLAMRLPNKPKVYAFDTDKAAQDLCRELTHKNNVQNQVVISGYCNPQEIETILRGRSLVVCDCEGYEIELLNPVSAPALINSEILVELHDKENQEITPVLKERFSPSHDIQLIDNLPRNPADYPILHFLDQEKQKVALSEFRYKPQQWAYMKPKSTVKQ